MLRRFFFAISISGAALLCSCALFDERPGMFNKDDPRYQSVEPLLLHPDFRSAHLPIRTLRVAVIMDESVEEDLARATFREASDLLLQQVGIQLEVTFFANRLKRSTRSFFPIHRALRQFRELHSDYDVIAGLSPTSSDDERPCFLGSCYLGMVDDGRNIALVTLSHTVIIHEVGHLFLGIGHSSSGVMKAIPENDYFSVANRKKILKNKWKDFRGGGMDPLRTNAP